MIVDINTLILSLLIVTVVNILFLVTYNLKHKDGAIKFFIISNGLYLVSFAIVVFKGSLFPELSRYMQNIFLIFGAIYELFSVLLTVGKEKVENKSICKSFLLVIISFLISYLLNFNVVRLTAITILILLLICVYQINKFKKDSFIAQLLGVIYSSFLVIMAIRNIAFSPYNLEYIISLIGLIVLRVSCTLGLLLISREKIDKELLHYASYDGLTNLLNRRTFISESEFFLKSIDKKKCVFLLIDIDFFKKINDTYGHLIGDKILISFSKFLKNNFKSEDLCGRYGGEEFGVLLKNIDEQEAIDLANKLLVNISKKEIDGISFTVSIGVSIYKSGKTIDDLYKEADVALYNAKNNGRNRIFIYENENHF